MADALIILILVIAAGLALRSCLRKSKNGRCPGGCSDCSGNCGCIKDKRKQ